MAKLTAKQEAFCNEYLIDLNATQAAIRAGYSPNTSHVIGTENLGKPEINERVQELMALRSERTRISADRVLHEIARLGFSDLRDYFTPDNGILKVTALDDNAAAALQSMKVTKKVVDYDDEGNAIVGEVVEFKLADKSKNLELLGRHLALFNDKLIIKKNPAEGLTKDEIKQALVSKFTPEELEAARVETSEPA